ncbi:MAG TPA: DUF1002 domain-containing protein [Bacillota bacterium]|nr:DUF1002 domain-containing protein [Bacillota bacterium]HOG52379.1 DUF1002 domain-containing protein [Bacillota bacterium]
MKKSLTTALVLILSMAAIGTAFGAGYAKDMILGYGEKLTDPQKALMKVQLGASTQSGQEKAGEGVEPFVVARDRETEPYQGLLTPEEMGPVGVSAAFLKKNENGGVWVTKSNNDIAPVAYANALYTAGARNTIFSLSSAEPVPGFMVLGIAIEAYEKLNGVDLSDEDVKMAAEELILTNELGRQIGHYEMGAEVVAFAKEHAEKNEGADAAEIADVIKDRIALYERSSEGADLKTISEYIVRYAANGDDHQDMPVQLAALRAEQLWLVEPMERMVDPETLAQADEELEKLLSYLDKEEKEPTFLEKNSSWLFPAGLVVVAAALSIIIAYFQTRPKKADKKKA